MIYKSLTAKRVSMREILYKNLRISSIKHIYRSYIRANIVSLLRKYSLTKDLLKRFHDNRSTQRRYRGLKRLIRTKIETKKISRAWKSKNYSLFLKLIFLLEFKVNKK